MTEPSTTPRTDALLDSLDARKVNDEAGSCALILLAQQLEEELTAQKVSLSEAPEMRWVPVGDRMPESVGERVLVRTGENNYQSAYFNPTWIGGFGTGIFSGSYVAKVTHWMPLPKEPK